MELTLTFTEDEHLSVSMSGSLDRTSLTRDFWQMHTHADTTKIKACKQITISLQAIDRADTAGLAWLINIVRDANKHNIKVIFTEVPDKLLNLAELSGAKDILKS